LEAPPPAYELEAPLESLPPPDYAGVTENGRIDIDLNNRLSRALIRLAPEPGSEKQSAPVPSRRYTTQKLSTPRLNIVIQVVGSRGDVQPFVALGQELQKYGHRVRLATHNVFDAFVRESDLEFFPIGGDPKELMAYMVKNPGLIPSMKSLREGDIQRKRAMVSDILDGCWKSCVEPDPVSKKPFVADAIIANPPSFAHIHCAQALSVPLHLMFTMPWSSTKAFPHPLANFKIGDLDPAKVNYASYGIVEWMTWQGLGDVINQWRKTLDLEPLPLTVGPSLTEALEIPFTYCWSPALVPKPIDWPSHIDVCGFFFRDPPAYEPSEDMDKFLRAGPPPVYIGFGSIVIDDPAKMTSLVLEAVRMCGVRAIISRGWSNLGAELSNEPEDVLFIGDCPHEWLFQYVSAVVHHGGAGTVACGLRNACPTVVVPFFGDQPFWGDMVAAAGAGPSPIPQKSLTPQNLAEAIGYCLTPSATAFARDLSERMASERGVEAAAQSFHANLPFEMHCDINHDLSASWTYKKAPIRLSKLAAQILVENAAIDAKDLVSYEPNSITIENPRWDPLTSITSSGSSVVYSMHKNAFGMIVNPLSEFHRGVSSNQSGLVTAGKMAGSVGKTFGKFNAQFFKGTIVDIPLAATEGFRNVPKLYGEEVQSHGPVTDWKSGGIVAGKNFAHGMADGVSGLFVKPFEDAKKEGAVGFAKGLGKGLIGFGTKTASAGLGLVAYPGEGICKSIRYAARSSTRNRIRAAKLAEGERLSGLAITHQEVQIVVDRFERLKRERPSTSAWS
jgi:UDP:flavonoid glycosyltransferase YjiC (YdhE family)